MIIIKHGCRSKLKRWKFKCSCGCEWIADETEADRIYIYTYEDVITHNLVHYRVMCSCPDCERDVEEQRRIDADEYERLYTQKEESH